MWIINYLENIIEHPEEMKKVKKFFFILGALFIMIDITLVVLYVTDVAHLIHPHFPWDYVPGFSSFYGLLSTYLIIVISKWIGHAFLMKPEDFYND